MKFGPTVQMLIYNEEAFNEVSETEVTTAHKASSQHQTVKPAILKLFETVVPYTGWFQYPKEFYNVLWGVQNTKHFYFIRTGVEWLN